MDILARLMAPLIAAAVVFCLGFGAGYYVTHNHWVKKWDENQIAQAKLIDDQRVKNEQTVKEEKTRADTSEAAYLAALAALNAARTPAPHLRLCAKPRSSAMPATSNAIPAADAAGAGAGLGEAGTGQDFDTASVYLVAESCEAITEQLRQLQQWAK